MKVIFKLNWSKLWQSLVALVLVVVVVLGNAGNAMAARTGGRIGGGSFRAPSRSYSTPRSGGYSGGYRSPGYGYGGGFGFPFLLPFVGYGGGSNKIGQSRTVSTIPGFESAKLLVEKEKKTRFYL